MQGNLNIKTLSTATSNNLESIEKQIEEAREHIHNGSYLEEEDTDLVEIEKFESAVDFLRKYARYIQNSYNEIISTPYIDVLRDGSISVDWVTEKAKFLIIFKKGNSDLAYFYGERNNKIPYKGAIEIDGEIDKSLALWMKEYLA